MMRIMAWLRAEGPAGLTRGVRSSRVAAAALAAVAVMMCGASRVEVGAQQLPTRLVLGSAYVVEGESLVGKAAASAGQVGRQEMAGFGSGWSGNAQLFWGAPAAGAELRFQITVPAAGQYTISVYHTQAPDFGMVAVHLDGTRVGSYNGYHTAVRVNKTTLRPVTLTQGAHNVVLQVFGKDERSKNFFVGLDKLTLEPAGAAPGTPSAGARDAKRSGLTRVQRLTRAMDQSKEEDPLLPVVMHALERALAGPQRSGESFFDQAADQALQRHPEVNRTVLRQLVSDYASVPERTRLRGAPAGTSNLNVVKPLDPNAMRSIVAAINARKPPSLSSSGPSIVGVKPIGSGLIEAMINPMIIRIEPEAAKGYEPGQTVTLVGQNFSANKADNSIRVLEELAGGSKGEVMAVPPAVASTQALKVVVPKTLTPGRYAVQVAVKQGGQTRQSNIADLTVKAPPPPPPVISGITPQPQYPGMKVLIQGSNLKASSPVCGVWFKPLEGQPLAASVMLKGDRVAFALAKVLNATQMEVTLPPYLMAGKYLVVTEVPGAGMSPWVEYQVRAYRYQVNFLSILCKDESDPEWAGGDELVASWVIAADDKAWAKSTGDHSNYENFDDGDTDSFHPSDRSVFVPGGGAGEVKKALAIATSLYEWDAGDVKAVNEVIGTIGDIGSGILTATGQVAPAALVQALMPAVKKVVAWLGGNPDHLGTRYLGWSALDLLQGTSNPQGRFAGELHFDNDDDTGSYKLTYEVVRMQE